VLSELRRPKGSPRVAASFAALADDEVFLSVLTIGELRKGIDRLRAGKKKSGLEQWLRQLVAVASDRILPIDVETASLWGELTAKLEKAGRPLPAIDCLIAATAIRHGLHLMTRNVADFEPTGVLLVDPWQASR
jgi:Predicted nucleic acid-binding protein, contains PIN domain